MVTSLHYHQPSTITSKYNGNYGFISNFTEFQMKFLVSRSEQNRIMVQSAGKQHTVNALSLFMDVQVNLHKELHKKCA